MNQVPELFLKSGALLSLDEERVALGWGDWTRSASPPEGRLAFYAPDFFLEDTASWWMPRHSRILPRQAMIAMLRDRLSGTSEALPAWDWVQPRRQDFQDSFEDLQKSFAAGSLKKGVPIVFERTQGRISEALLAKLLLELLSKDRGRVYGFWDSEASEGLLGLTPEDLFVTSTKGEMRTMALAGTYPRGAGAPALLADPKERREHQWVIDGIRESLSPLGEVRVGETGVAELPTLLHLKTRIEVKPSRPISFMEWVHALHPTAALGAFPREAGSFWLRAQDAGVRRARFGAPFGVLLESGEGVCVVAIRNIQWEGREIRLGSGCGVVAESVIDREWNELALKRKSVKRNFGW